MATKIGINGFGRIGRLALRSCFTECQDKGTVMAINDHSKDPDYLMYLLKYDSVGGRLNADIKVDGDSIVVNGKAIKVLAERDPAAVVVRAFWPASVVGTAEDVVRSEEDGRPMQRRDAAAAAAADGPVTQASDWLYLHPEYVAVARVCWETEAERGR